MSIIRTHWWYMVGASWRTVESCLFWKQMYKYIWYVIFLDHLYTKLAKDLNEWADGWWKTPTSINVKNNLVTNRKKTTAKYTQNGNSQLTIMGNLTLNNQLRLKIWKKSQKDRAKNVSVFNIGRRTKRKETKNKSKLWL